jgi:glycosyltransferase involved in cell wall biosynthesis
LHEHLGVPRERIHVFGGAPALHARDAAPLTTAELRELRLEPPLVLRYGGYTARKNVPLLLEAWQAVPNGTLVLAGPPQVAREAILAGAVSVDRVVALDYVPQELLARLLRTAAVFVSPSLYEGFGLPPLEAMAAGTPVVAVATQFAREVCGEAAMLVPDQPSALAAAMSLAMTNRGESERLRAAGLARAAAFTWQGAARAVLRAYQHAAPDD